MSTPNHPHGLLPAKKAPARLLVIHLLALGALFLSATPATAAVELETDPLAFWLNGYSFHVALAREHSRTDLGVFALELPEDAKNPGYRVAFQGVGVKWDYTGNSADGGFWGMEVSQATLTFDYTPPGFDQPTESAEREVRLVGVRTGYRFGHETFYITPWIGISQMLGMKAVELGGVPYDAQKVQVFPTIHLGYRF